MRACTPEIIQVEAIGNAAFISYNMAYFVFASAFNICKAQIIYKFCSAIIASNVAAFDV